MGKKNKGKNKNKGSSAAPQPKTQSKAKNVFKVATNKSKNKKTKEIQKKLKNFDVKGKQEKADSTLKDLHLSMVVAKKEKNSIPISKPVKSNANTGEVTSDLDKMSV